MITMPPYIEPDVIQTTRLCTAGIARPLGSPDDPGMPQLADVTEDDLALYIGTAEAFGLGDAADLVVQTGLPQK